MGFFMSTKIGGILAFTLDVSRAFQAMWKKCEDCSGQEYSAFLSLTASGDSPDVKCENIYKDFSECVLELGESMDNYQENVTSESGVAAVCSHWEAFHTCALTALSDCQEEVSSIWETLRQDSRKIRFQGSLFDLCSPSSSPGTSSPLAALTLPLMLVVTTGPSWCSV